MSGKRILITGGAGFIGSHLSERLIARGDEITILDDFNDFYDPAIKRQNVATLLENDACKLVEGDIRDTELVERLFGEGRFDASIPSEPDEILDRAVRDFDIDSEAALLEELLVVLA